MSDRKCFDDLRQAAKRIALIELSQFIESLEVNNLQSKERDGRIYVEIGKVEEDMKGYSDYQYIMYYDYPSILFKLFENNNLLLHPEKLDIFIQCMIRREKYNILSHLFMEDRRKEQAENFNVNPPIILPNLLNEQNRITRSLPWQNLYLPNASGIFPKAMNPSLPQSEFTVEEILTMIIIKLNKRIGYLKYESDIQPLVRIILNPTEVESWVEIPLGCKTTEFKCSISHFQLYNKDFTYANVGRTCCFISAYGNLITAGNLGSTTCKNLNTRHAIDNIFAEFRKK